MKMEELKLTQNRAIAERLREAADLLEHQQANRFRVAAYRKAADTVESLQEDVGDFFRREGPQGLTLLPGIGVQLAAAIGQMVQTGHWPQLERLRGTLDPEALFSGLPGVGPRLAHRIVNELHIDTLESLEAAAYDGRLGNLSGFGNRRLAMVRTEVAERLGRARRTPAAGAEPSVELLLDVDREYREKASAGQLRRIAPKRFNPTHEAWLPILHTERDHWHFTALFSNTALAHHLGRTRDWVVIYFQSDSHEEGQRTAVTEIHGVLFGERVIRGRETECVEHYRTLWSPDRASPRESRENSGVST